MIDFHYFYIIIDRYIHLIFFSYLDFKGIFLILDYIYCIYFINFGNSKFEQFN